MCIRDRHGCLFDFPSPLLDVLVLTACSLMAAFNHRLFLAAFTPSNLQLARTNLEQYYIQSTILQVECVFLPSLHLIRFSVITQILLEPVLVPSVALCFCCTTRVHLCGFTSTFHRRCSLPTFRTCRRAMMFSYPTIIDSIMSFSPRPTSLMLPAFILFL